MYNNRLGQYKCEYESTSTTKKVYNVIRTVPNGSLCSSDVSRQNEHSGSCQLEANKKDKKMTYVKKLKKKKLDWSIKKYIIYL